MAKDFAEELVMDEPSAPAATPAPEVKPAPTPDPSAASRARNPDGTFAKKVDDEGVEKGTKPEPEQAAAPAAPELPSGNEGKHVPLAQMDALRETAAKQKARIEELEKLVGGAGKSTPNQPQTPSTPNFSFEVPSYEDDPEGNFQGQLHQMKLHMSHNMAAQQYGEGKVNEAWAAFDTACRNDPRVYALASTLANHPHPIGEVMKWHAQQKEIAEIQEAGGLEGYSKRLREKWEAERTQAPAPTAASPAPAAPARQLAPEPPPSLVVGGAGQGKAPQTQTSDEVFDRIFDKSQRARKR